MRASTSSAPASSSPRRARCAWGCWGSDPGAVPPARAPRRPGQQRGGPPVPGDRARGTGGPPGGLQPPGRGAGATGGPGAGGAGGYIQYFANGRLEWDPFAGPAWGSWARRWPAGGGSTPPQSRPPRARCASASTWWPRRRKERGGRRAFGARIAGAGSSFYPGRDERWVLVSIPQQRTTAYEGMRTVFSDLCSTGRADKGLTTRGLYAIQRASRTRSWTPPPSATPRAPQVLPPGERPLHPVLQWGRGPALRLVAQQLRQPHVLRLRQPAPQHGEVVLGLGQLRDAGARRLTQRPGGTKARPGPPGTPGTPAAHRLPADSGGGAPPERGPTLFVVREPLLTAERSEFLSHLYLAPDDPGAAPLQLTFGEHRNYAPRWARMGAPSPSSHPRRLAVRPAQRLRHARGRGRVLGPHPPPGPRGARLEWAPDGRHLALLLPDSPSAEEEQAQRSRDDARVWGPRRATPTCT